MSRPIERPRDYVKHGLTAVIDAARRLDDNWIDTLGDVGAALRTWRGQLIASLGGEPMVSTQERAVVDLATRTFLLLESVDRWLLAQPSLINKSRRQLYPIVLQRQQLADSLSRYMGQLEDGPQGGVLDGERGEHLDRQWLKRRARRLPFARKLSRKVTRFSQRGLERWHAAQAQR